MNYGLRYALCPLLILALIAPQLFAAQSAQSEVIEETNTRVVVRAHPKTGRPYVSIAASDPAIPDPFADQKKNSRRPDYRMLDPNVKSGEIPYEGPYSDRRKVYALAAGLAAAGVAGALAIPITPVTGAGASAGAGGFAGAGAGVAAGTVAVTTAATRSNNANFTHESETRLQKDAPLKTIDINRKDA